MIARPVALVLFTLLSFGCASTKGEDRYIPEADPNATKTVVPIDFKGAPPADMEVQGKFHSAFGWTDQYGRNAVVISITSSTAGDATTSMLIAEMVLWEGDAWTTQRSFKERIEKCQFDTELTPLIGDWSVTDLDKNGLGEATFAYRAGCRSDVSPVAHKVIMATHLRDGSGVAKYILRGQTGVDAGAGVEGGKFTPGKAIKGAPASFLAHVTAVWAKTSVESMK